MNETNVISLCINICRYDLLMAIWDMEYKRQHLILFIYTRQQKKCPVDQTTVT